MLTVTDAGSWTFLPWAQFGVQSFSTRSPVACAVDWPHPDHCRCVRAALASPQASVNDAGVSTDPRVQLYITARCVCAVDVAGTGGGVAVVGVVLGGVVVGSAVVTEVVTGGEDGVDVVDVAANCRLGAAGGAPAVLLRLPMGMPASKTAIKAKTPASIGHRYRVLR